MCSVEAGTLDADSSAEVAGLVNFGGITFGEAFDWALGEACLGGAFLMGRLDFTAKTNIFWAYFKINLWSSLFLVHLVRAPASVYAPKQEFQSNNNINAQRFM